MTEPFLGEIRVFSFPTPPNGWAYCDGAVLPISQNQALYSLIGTSFGGDAKANFQLPDFQGRVALGTGKNPNSGASYLTGKAGGTPTVVLTPPMMPAHQHSVRTVTTVGNTFDPPNAIMAQAAQGTNGGGIQVAAPLLYGAPTNPVALNAGVISTVGANGGHPNLQPYTTVNFCIALSGNYPPRPD